MIRADYLSAVAVLGVAAYLGLPFVRGTGRPGQGGYQLRLADLGARTALGGLLWTWAGDGTAQAYLAGYLIEKSLSVKPPEVHALCRRHGGDVEVFRRGAG